MTVIDKVESPADNLQFLESEEVHLNEPGILKLIHIVLRAEDIFLARDL